MIKLIPWKRSSRISKIGCRTFIVRIRNSSRKQEVAKLRRRRINSSKSSKIGDNKGKGTLPLSIKEKVKRNLLIY